MHIKTIEDVEDRRVYTTAQYHSCLSNLECSDVVVELQAQ